MNTPTLAVLSALEKRGGSVSRIETNKTRDDIDEMIVLSVTGSKNAKKASRDIVSYLQSHNVVFSIEKGDKWAVITVDDTVIHIFTAEAARFYRLDNLWGMCPIAQIA